MSAPDANGWLDISTAPKDGASILCFAYGSKQAVCRWIDGHWTLYHMNDKKWLAWLRGPEKWLALSEAPTHWQPLPPNPHSNTTPIAFRRQG